MKKNLVKKNVFSIRKLTIGAAAVLISTTFLGSFASTSHAAVENQASQPSATQSSATQKQTNTTQTSANTSVAQNTAQTSSTQNSTNQANKFANIQVQNPSYKLNEAVPASASNLVKNLPTGASAKWLVKPVTTSAGTKTATIQVTLADGSTKTYTVTYTVVAVSSSTTTTNNVAQNQAKPATNQAVSQNSAAQSNENQANKFANVQVQNPSYKLNQAVPASPANFITNLPSGASAKWLVKPSTTSAGTHTARVQVTLADGSTKVYDVTYTVVASNTTSTNADKQATSSSNSDDLSKVSVVNQNYTQNQAVSDDASSVFKNLPAGAKASWVVKPNTSKVGNFTATAKITLANGSSKTYTVNYSVKGDAKAEVKSVEKKDEAKPVAKPTEKKAEAKPVEKKGEAKPVAKPTEKKAEAKPVEKKGEAKPAAKPTEKKAEAKPVEKKSEAKKDANLTPLKPTYAKDASVPATPASLIKNLPTGAKAQWLTKPDTSKAGTHTAKARVTLSDGTVKIITITYVVTAK